MPTPTYVPLGTVTLGGSDASIEFSSIPATYRDIIAVINGTASVVAGGRMFLNSDTSSSYTTVRMYGVGSGSGVSDTAPSSTYGYIGDVFATSVTSIVIQLMDYSATDKHKTWLYRMNNAGNYVMAGASRWPVTTAVNNIKFELNDARTYQTGTTISIYGVN